MCGKIGLGIVFDREEALKGKKNMLKRALRDLDPGLREPVKMILELSSSNGHGFHFSKKKKSFIIKKIT